MPRNRDDNEDDIEEHDDDEPDDDDDSEDPPDEETIFQNIEAAFRTERARVRACDDLHELRTIRSEFQALSTSPRANAAARRRINDLIEILDDRVTDIKAKRLRDGRD